MWMKLLLVLVRSPFLPVLLTATLAAQQPIAPPPKYGPSPQISEQIESIDILPIPNAPFSASLVSELSTVLADGSKRTIWSHRLVAWDSSGRVFQERHYFSPAGKTEPTRISVLQYDDPDRGQRYFCTPPDRICRLSTVTFYISSQAPSPVLPPSTTHADGTTVACEALGEQILEGLDVRGTRETKTIPAGLLGNERSEAVVNELWYLPRLGNIIAASRTDPMAATVHNFTLTQINLSEPDPKLFDLPVGFRILLEEDHDRIPRH
jgi:hypothetical protein